ncbi:MAG TPA: dehydrogenase E1 component subunit alpha/beta [Saprospiraceae bacterium]|nr:dehydrogenase E1 component subunit alpha/beta [Saprospiraceae bacterium]
MAQKSIESMVRKIEFEKYAEFFDRELILELYRGLLLPRMIEEKMLNLLRQGKISKWFAGIGQEAISVGCTKSLHANETIFTMHRNLGVFTSREVPLKRLFCQWMGKPEGFTQGRDRSFHFGSKEHHIAGMISHLGPQLSLACGVALAHKLQREHKVALAFTGEGGTSQGEFHEALNLASVWKLPVIFVIENNGYGLSTPVNEQYNCMHLADRGIGYGMEAHILDGNNVLEVYHHIRKTALDLRENPRPVLIECKTFRMRGHEEASGTKYVPEELMQEWAQRDPVKKFEEFLLEKGLCGEEQIERWKSEFKKEINENWRAAEEAPDVKPVEKEELNDVYQSSALPSSSDEYRKKEMRFVDALAQGLHQCMETYPELVLMGQDIAEYGGVFKITEGLLEKYGPDRVRNTPLCESAIVGAALGLSMEGQKAMMEMQFADFVTCGFNQIVNNLAKIHYRWQVTADVVIRMPTGGTVGAGPFHSQSNEAWFFHTPGLKIVYPSNPEDAKGLLMSAIHDPNPVMYFEHKALYRKITGEVPEGNYYTPFGKARTIREGSEATIITYGMGVHWAQEIIDSNPFDVGILDLRSLKPLDWEAITKAVKNTNRILILHEDTLMGGIGAEISAYITEHLFEYLDAPIMRLGAMETPVPFNTKLEEQFMPKRLIKPTLDQLLNY